MTGLIAPVARLIDELSRLPGVGRKTAQRLAYHVLRAPADEARALAEALVAVKEQVAYCSICCNITDMASIPAMLGSAPTSRICVVEEPLDVLAIERTGEFRGTTSCTVPSAPSTASVRTRSRRELIERAAQEVAE